ncbi:MAG: creatininase family protein [Chloroflexota bacterium]
MLERNKRGQKILWQDLTRPEFEEAVAEQAMVVVPIGSTEQHGPHLPVSVDMNNAYNMALEAARRLDDPRVVVAPPLWTGYSPHHLDFAGTISLDLATFQAVVMHVCASIHRHGFRGIFILNGHGGNTAPIISVCQELAVRGVFVATATWWNLIVDELWQIGESPLGGMAHACEAETSLQMLLQPEALHLEARVKEMHPLLISQAKNDFRQMGPVTYGFNFKKETTHGVVGDPTLATLEKGQRIFEAAVGRLVEVLGEYSKVER